MSDNNLQQTSQSEITISDPWSGFTKDYPISLLEAVLWMTGLVGLQQGAHWLVEAGHLTLPAGAPGNAVHAVLFVAATLVLLGYWKLIRKAKLRALGFQSEGWGAELKFTAQMLALGAVVYVVAGALFWAALHFFADDATGAFKGHLRNSVFRDDSLLYMLAVVVLYPIVEELWYRGLLYTPMRQQMGRVPAIILLSLMFAFAHGWYPVNQFIGGLLFVWAYEKRRSLFTPIVLHIVGNGILALFGVALDEWPAFSEFMR